MPIRARACRPRCCLFDVNDDMWAHRSKTTERAAGVVGATASIHLSRGSDLFGAQSPAARNIPFGTSFVLLMARSTPTEGGPRVSRGPSPDMIIEYNAVAATQRRRYRSSPPTGKVADDAPLDACFDSFVNGLSKSKLNVQRNATRRGAMQRGATRRDAT